MGHLVNITKLDGIATVTINNPPMNVLSSHVIKDLNEAFSEIEADNNVIVVILTGEGQRAFMAGADIKEFPEWVHLEKEQLKTTTMNIHQVLNRIENLAKPTIAMLNGITFGGGCELALTCDLRIAEEHVQIGLPEVKLGLFPGGGGTQRLPRLIGEAKAKELMFLGDPISAFEAEALGLVNKVVPNGKGMETTLKLAKKMSSYSLEALSRIKKSVNEGMDLDLQKALQLEVNYFAGIFQTEDVKEGLQAFIEKRAPKFKHC